VSAWYVSMCMAFLMGLAQLFVTLFCFSFIIHNGNLFFHQIFQQNDDFLMVSEFSMLGFDCLIFM
jgi:hypothetical protein